MNILTLLILYYLAAIFFFFGTSTITTNNYSFFQNLIHLEVSMLGVMLSFLIFSMYLGDAAGQIYALYILVLVAAESCFGLAIVTVAVRSKTSVDFNARHGNLNTNLIL